MHILGVNLRLSGFLISNHAVKPNKMGVELNQDIGIAWHFIIFRPHRGHQQKDGCGLRTMLRVLPHHLGLRGKHATVFISILIVEKEIMCNHLAMASIAM